MRPSVGVVTSQLAAFGALVSGAGSNSWVQIGEALPRPSEAKLHAQLFAPLRREYNKAIPLPDPAQTRKYQAFSRGTLRANDTCAFG